MNEPGISRQRHLRLSMAVGTLVAAVASLPAMALDGRGGGACGASLLHVMFNPVLIVLALVVTATVGSAIATWRCRRAIKAVHPTPQTGTHRTRRQQPAVPASPEYRIFSKPAIVVGVCTYLLLLAPAWVFSNLCF